MQIDLLVNAPANDMTRVASLQFMISWSGSHAMAKGRRRAPLSHEPDSNQDAQDKLLRINQWFAGELAYLADQLAQIPNQWSKR